MGTTLRPRFGTVQRKPPLSLDVRIAERLGVSIQAVRGWRFGHAPSRPQSRVAGMVEVCLEAGDHQEVARLLHPIDVAKRQIVIPEFSVGLQASTQEVDALEDVAEARFSANPCRDSYLPWRRAMLAEIAQLQRLVISGDQKFL